MKFKIMTLLFMTVTFLQLMAIGETSGTRGFQFLKLNYSAKALGMANAYTGQSDDLDALFFNPAGLAKITQRTAKTFYSSYVVDTNGGAVAFSTPAKNNINIGIFSQFMTSGDITRTEETSSGGYVENGTFSTSDFLIGVCGGYTLNQYFDLGAAFKYTLSSLDGHSASAIAADLGLIHQTNNKNLRVGLAVRNVGVQLSYYTSSQYKEELPMTLSGGFHYSVNPAMNINLDICRPLDNDFYLKLGSEYKITEIFAVRAGFDSRFKDYKAGGDYEGISGLSTGFSVNYKRYILDYGIASYGDLGFNNLVSLGYQF